jgi:hypothetical protein
VYIVPQIKAIKKLKPMKQFSRKTTQLLKHYVYVLVDPRTEEIFYVGKGSGSARPFDHLKMNTAEPTEKDQKIRTLRSQSIEPRVDILRHGLDARAAKEIEASVIDALGLQNLSNQNSGADSSERGRMSAMQIEARLGGQPLDISHIAEPVILFHRRDTFPESRLYDETRQFWPLSLDRIEARNEDGNLKYQFAFAMRGNFVLEIYKILAWYQAGTTVSSRAFRPRGNKRCWEFIGSVADEKIGKKYRNRSLMKNGAPLHATQIGFRYLG